VMIGANAPTAMAMMKSVLSSAGRRASNYAPVPA
jgi:hypothetical protein